MGPVRLRDVPAVTWTLAQAFNPTRTEAILSVPLWSLMITTEPSLRHDRGRVTVSVKRRGPVLGLRALLRIFGVVVLALSAWVAFSVALELRGVRVPSWLFAAAVLMPLLPGVVVMFRRPGGRAALLRPARKLEADYVVDFLASRDPAGGGMIRAAAYVRSIVPAGASVGTRAASAELARIYRRFGFVPDVDDPLLLVRPA